MINLMDYQNQPYYCGGVKGQAGHGTAEGCSSLFTGSDDVCTNELHFYHNSGKNQILPNCHFYSPQRFTPMFPPRFPLASP